MTPASACVARRRRQIGWLDGSGGGGGETSKSGTTGGAGEVQREANQSSSSKHDYDYSTAYKLPRAAKGRFSTLHVHDSGCRKVTHVLNTFGCAHLTQAFKGGKQVDRSILSHIGTLPIYSLALVMLAGAPPS